MAVPDSIRYLRVSAFCGVVPIAFNAAIFLLWCLFRSDFFVVTWTIAFLVGLAAVLLGTICLIIATVRKMVRKQSSWPISGLRTLATVAVLFAYFPTSAFTAASYLRLSRRPSVDIVDAAGRKDFYLFEEVKQFLDDDAGCVNARDDHGYTALHLAAFRCREELVELLISRGADVKTKIANDLGQSALHVAANDRSVPIIVALIAAGADPNTKDSRGDTPLHSAAEWAKAKAVKALLDHGADVNVTNGEGKTPLDLAEDQMRIQAGPPEHYVEDWRECIRKLRARGGVSAIRKQPPGPTSPDQLR